MSCCIVVVSVCAFSLVRHAMGTGAAEPPLEWINSNGMAIAPFPTREHRTAPHPPSVNRHRVSRAAAAWVCGIQGRSAASSLILHHDLPHGAGARGDADVRAVLRLHRVCEAVRADDVIHLLLASVKLRRPRGRPR